MARITRLALKSAVTTGAVLAVAGITAASAFAATTYTVKAGTTVTGTQAYKAATKTGTTDSPGISFVDKTTGTALGCISGTAAGVATLGKTVSAKVATISDTSWTSCAGPLGIVLSPSQVGAWQLNAKGKTSSSGVTKGFINNVNATVTGSGCSFSVKGAVDASYTNSTSALKVATVAGTGNVLKISGVSGCFGQINNNDVVSFKANYKVTTTAGALSIKSNA